MRVYSIIGATRNIGKTRIIEQLIKEFKERGIPVTVIKHTEKDLDMEGKDTYRFMKTGAEKTIALTPNGATIFTREKSLEKVLEKYVEKRGIILVEGLKRSKYPKIVIVEVIDEIDKLKFEGKLLAIVVKNNLKKYAIRGKPIYRIDEIGKIADLIENTALKETLKCMGGLNCGLCGYKSCKDYAKAIIHGDDWEGKCKLKYRVKLEIDGREIQIKPYVEYVLFNIIDGYVKTLKGYTPKFKEVKVKIEDAEANT
ncbi:MAG: molybdopterin-guanine dinucleotide biosynthesis protein B [archaeon GB-1867-097]|nr:molybdopterin-guanine dinucleotide biosynthesis protein B [Candidatus Culexmicrobium thermophilum]MCS7384898.1 molybdopterin-guanine dinucleotide biosynthesis protein B [Candidatus Culexmicrobium thermophilum]RLE57016.1 MAG: molybdopterin-guanine dinucleotide biosynthesis protein B [Candidatus Verstraetearchaeota archaeon]